MTSEQARLLSRIQELTHEFFQAAGSEEFVPGVTPVRLMEPTYD